MSATLAKHSGVKGVSLVEASVWGLSILVGIAVGAVLYNRRVTDEMVLLSKARETVRALNAALLMPRPQSRPMPNTTEGLGALVEDGTVSHIPNDPWGRAYVFRNPGREAAYDLLSLGPDGVESMDDVVIWNLYGTRAVVSQGGAGNRPRPAAPTPGADQR
ncbi:MAG: type II secretion system protein GspG [Rhodoferax sp.]|nr:type II secretion system protein GspG [Rhodoferax sp.]MDP3650396.1 type II secretion system protein GspG [Rhodoferax sp.]